MIEGKVARILNSRELVINRGSADGVELDMKFEVLDPNGERVIDPDTHDVLGSIARPKVRVRIAQLEERLAVGRTYESRRVNVGGRGSNAYLEITRALTPPEYVTRYVTLKTSESTWESIDEKESYIKTGDPVRQIVDEEPAAEAAGRAGEG